MVNDERVRAFQLGELHEYPMFMKICCDTLNSEWKRSETARMHSLQKSSSALPASLVMFEARSREFFGHARICRILERTDACFIESVIVMPEKRGRGLGRHLMELVEEYARGHGFCRVYLTTKDKQAFYEHLGYTYCEPMTASNCSSVNIEALEKQHKPFASTAVTTLEGMNNPLPPPPPPPPPPPHLSNSKIVDRNWMMKILK